MYVVFDCETYLITDTLKAPPVVSVALWDSMDSAGGVRLWSRDEGVEQMRERLRSPDTVFVGHNVAFDFTCLAAGDPSLIPLIMQVYDEGRVHDTMVMHRLSQIARGAMPLGLSLAALVNEHLNLDISDTKHGDDVWRLRYAELDGVPVDEWPESARAYAISDVEYTRDVYRVMWAKGVKRTARLLAGTHPLAIHTADRSADYGAEVAHQTRAAFVLHQPYVSGVALDRHRLAALRVEVDEQFYNFRSVAEQHGLIRPSGSKDLERIRDAVSRSYQARDGGEPPSTDKGAVSTASSTLRECVDDEGLQALAESAKSEKLLTAFIKPLQSLPTPIVHSSYNVLVDSGRTSARSPNVQQVKRDGGLRECYVARPGHVFIGADYDTLEMRSLAQVTWRLFRASRMRSTLQAGYDLHLDFAADLLGITYSEAVERKSAGDPEVKDARQFAKVADFGFPGGLGARTFCDYANGYGLAMTEQESRRLKDQFLRAWPEMRQYFKAAGEITRSVPEATTVVQGYGRVRGNITYTRACNTPFQGLAADGAKEALWLVQKACWTPGDALAGSRIALFVHDEIIIETREVDLESKKSRLVECMVDGMSRWIPDVPITAEPVVMRRWSKDAHNDDNEVWDAE